MRLRVLTGNGHQSNWFEMGHFIADAVATVDGWSSGKCGQFSFGYVECSRRRLLVSFLVVATVANDWSQQGIDTAPVNE